MAIGVIFTIPGSTISQYEDVCGALNGGEQMRKLSDWPGGGCLSHVAGTTPDGMRVVDIWESEQAFQAFGEKLMPLLDEYGMKAEAPEFFVVHNLVTA